MEILFEKILWFIYPKPPKEPPLLYNRKIDITTYVYMSFKSNTVCSKYVDTCLFIFIYTFIYFQL